MHMARTTTMRRTSGYLQTRHPGEFLSEDSLRRVVPSVFTDTAHESRSDRFRPIPTHVVLSALQRNGWGVVLAAQGQTRDASKQEHTKHMLRLRRLDAKTTGRRVGDVYPEVVLVNGNDGSSAYHLMAGLLRLVCLNGMTVSEQSFQPVRVSHTGDVVSKVIEGSYRVLGDSEQALDAADTWAGFNLPGDIQMGFAQAAHVIRFGDAEGNVPANHPIRPEQLLERRRPQDGRNDLWSTFNIVQENVIRGGLHGTRLADNGSSQRVTTRPIRGIDGDQRMNRALWTLAQALGTQFVTNAAATAA